MSRTRRVVWASVLSGVSTFVALAAALILLKLATRSLTVPDFGIFVLLQVFADALNLVMTLGLAVALPKLVAAAPEAEREHLAGAALAGVSLVGAAVSMALLAAWMLLSEPLGEQLGDEAAQLLAQAWLVPPLFLVGALRDTAMAALAGLHRYWHRALSIVVASVLSVALAAALVASGHTTVATFTGAIALGHGLNLIWLFLALPAGARWRVDLTGFADTVRASRPLWQNSLLTFVYQRVDTLIVQYLLGLGGAALLGAGKQFGAVLSRAMGAVMVPLLPNLAALVAAGDVALAARVMGRAALLSGVLGYSATLACLALSGPLVRLLTAPEYAEAAPLVAWLMAAACLGVQAGVFGQGLIAMGQAVWVTRVNAATAAFAVAANLVALPAAGVAGAAYTAVVAVALSGAAQAMLARRQGLAVAVRPLLVTHGLFAACFALAQAVSAGGGILGLAIAAVFPVLCIATGTLPAGELLTLLRALRPYPEDSPAGK